MERRTFIKMGIGGGLLAALLGFNKSQAEPLLRPPGAIDEASFLTTCARCGKCAEICQNECIKIAHGDQGIGIGTPYIEPLEKPCSLCMACTTVCSTGALRPIERNDVRMGIANIDYDKCLARNGEDCRVCHGNCMQYNMAIKLEQYKLPYVDSEYCTGCGVCENVCMARPKAIHITPLDRTRAKKVGNL